MVNERVARLEERVAGLVADVAQIKDDLREVRDALVGAKMAGRIALAVAAMIGALVGWWLS